jgi:hypothetical protein
MNLKIKLLLHYIVKNKNKKIHLLINFISNRTLINSQKTAYLFIYVETFLSLYIICSAAQGASQSTMMYRQLHANVLCGREKTSFYFPIPGRISHIPKQSTYESDRFTDLVT